MVTTCKQQMDNHHSGRQSTSGACTIHIIEDSSTLTICMAYIWRHRVISTRLMFPPWMAYIYIIKYQSPYMLVQVIKHVGLLSQGFAEDGIFLEDTIWLFNLGYPSMSYVLNVDYYAIFFFYLAFARDNLQKIFVFCFFPWNLLRERSENRRYIPLKLTQYSCNIMKNLIINIGLGKMHPINTSLVFFSKC